MATDEQEKGSEIALFDDLTRDCAAARPHVQGSDAVSVAMLQVLEADSTLRHVKELIFEYAQHLLEVGCDVGSFQDLDDELRELPGRYSRENGGCIYVGYPASSGFVMQAKEPASATACVKEGLPIETGEPMGCVAVKKLAEGVCEMKRLYVREKYRRFGVGHALATAAISFAKAQHQYKKMRLDSIERLTSARPLYMSLGFTDCAPYVENPERDAIFLELAL